MVCAKFGSIWRKNNYFIIFRVSDTIFLPCMPASFHVVVVVVVSCEIKHHQAQCSFFSLVCVEHTFFVFDLLDWSFASDGSRHSPTDGGGGTKWKFYFDIQSQLWNSECVYEINGFMCIWMDPNCLTYINNCKQWNWIGSFEFWTENELK